MRYAICDMPYVERCSRALTNYSGYHLNVYRNNTLLLQGFPPCPHTIVLFPIE